MRANIGGKTFDLAVDGDTAWTVDDDQDLRLIVAMKRGRRMVISAEAANGRQFVDTFSLMGFSDALDAAAADCR